MLVSYARTLTRLGIKPVTKVHATDQESNLDPLVQELTPSPLRKTGSGVPFSLEMTVGVCLHFIGQSKTHGHPQFNGVENMLVP